jgi:hypothetical protein
MGPMPFGAKPPWEVRLEKPPPPPGHSPRMNRAPRKRNTTIAATFMEANQNSNSP